MEIKSELVPPVPAETAVRITIEITEGRAKALAIVLDGSIDWNETPVEHELAGLYDALMYPVAP
jgi:hypothetical protein